MHIPSDLKTNSVPNGQSSPNGSDDVGKSSKTLGRQISGSSPANFGAGPSAKDGPARSLSDAGVGSNRIGEVAQQIGNSNIGGLDASMSQEVTERMASQLRSETKQGSLQPNELSKPVGKEPTSRSAPAFDAGPSDTATKVLKSAVALLSEKSAAMKASDGLARKRLDSDWSVKTPIIQNGEVKGAIIAHPEPIKNDDGRVELGKVEIYANGAKHDLTVHRPEADKASIDVNTTPNTAPPESQTAESRTKDFLRALPKGEPSSAPTKKVGAHISSLVAAGAVARMVGPGIQAGLTASGVPPSVAGPVTAAVTGVIADATMSGVFAPELQRPSEDAETSGNGIKNDVSAPAVNFFSKAPTDDQNSPRTDDASFGRAASSQVEMMAILSREIPSSVILNQDTGLPGFAGLDPLVTFADNRSKSELN